MKITPMVAIQTYRCTSKPSSESGCGGDRPHFVKLIGLIVLLSTAVTMASPGEGEPAPVNLDEALAAYRDWWYKCDPYPSDAARAIVKADADGPASKPESSFWVARDIIRSAYGRLTRSQVNEINELYRRAAAGGFAPAVAYDVAKHLENRDDTGRKEALQTLADLVLARDSDAAMLLGSMTLYGEGVNKDPAGAKLLLQHAAKWGQVRAYAELAIAYAETGDIDDAVRTARTGAERGDPVAQRLLAGWLLNGRVDRADPVAAEQWLRKAASKGEPRSLFELSALLLVKEDADAWAEGLQMLQAAADAGLMEAEFEMARVHLYGLWNQPVNIPDAENVLRKLAKEGHSGANYELGLAYLTGVWLPRDEQAALKHLTAAAKQGHQSATNLLRTYGARPAKGGERATEPKRS